MRVTIALDGPDLEIPQHPDGEVWPHVIEHGGPDGDEMTFADSAGEALGLLIEGYDDIPENNIVDAEDARFFHAARVASAVQAYAVRDAIDKEKFTMEDADEATLTALMTDKTETLPIDLFEGDWTNEVPLFLVDLNYAPFTTRDLPSGNVMVLRVHDEVDYLTSLHQIGMIRYSIQATGIEKEN